MATARNACDVQGAVMADVVSPWHRNLMDISAYAHLCGDRN